MLIDITNNQTSMITNTIFNPTEKQYIALYNFSVLFLSKGYGLDVYCGVGGSYNMFNQGATIDKTR